MANLAIKGHPTRGIEVIQLLEMLGGVNAFNLDGAMDNYYYYIDKNSNKIYHCLSINLEYGIIYTLEEFEEKFPYKVGDKVKCHNIWKGIIESMEWYEGEVLYHVRDYPNNYLASETVEHLQPYKEETMEEKDEKTVKHVFNANVISFDIAQKDKYELDLQGKFKVVLREGKYYVERIKLRYPKTYMECCDVLGVPNDERYVEVDNPVFQNKLIESFTELLICRNAYWKIASDWKYDVNKTEEYFYIVNKCDSVVKEHYMNFNHILAFPTAEMRDAFYENFKDLINECKELL